MLRAAGGSVVTSRSPISTRPPSAASRPAIRRSVVDLPQPEGPSSTLSVPSANRNDTPSTARTLPSAVVQCLLTFSTAIAATRTDPDAKRGSLAEKRRKRGPGIGRAHESLADQERVHALGTHECDIARGDDAAFGDDEAILRHMRQEIERRVERDAEIAQVAVVDAEQR